MEIGISISIDTEEIGQLIERFLPRRAGTAQPIIERHIIEQQPTAKGKRKPDIQEPPAEVAIELAPGNIAYRVEIDGVPTTWKLDYTSGQIPAKRGSLVEFDGKAYRISKLYGTNVYLTSMESENHWARPDVAEEQRL